MILWAIIFLIGVASGVTLRHYWPDRSPKPEYAVDNYGIKHQVGSRGPDGLVITNPNDAKFNRDWANWILYPSLHSKPLQVDYLKKWTWEEVARTFPTHRVEAEQMIEEKKARQQLEQEAKREYYRSIASPMDKETRHETYLDIDDSVIRTRLRH